MAKKIYLNDIKGMLDGLSIEKAVKVHLLFRNRCIEDENEDNWFTDDFLLGNYYDSLSEFISYREKKYLKELNGYVIDILEEWRQNATSRYRKGRKVICDGIERKWTVCNSPFQKETQELWSAVMERFNKDNSKDGRELALILTPTLMTAIGFMSSGHYNEALGNIFCLLEFLRKTMDRTPEWFGGFLNVNEGYNDDENTDIAVFTMATMEVYCYIRRSEWLLKEQEEDLDIQLEAFNNRVGFSEVLDDEFLWHEMSHWDEHSGRDFLFLSDCKMLEEWKKRMKAKPEDAEVLANESNENGEE